MCLERAFSGYLAYFFEVGLRGDTKGGGGEEGGGVRSGPGEARTILLFDIISARPSKLLWYVPS
jgi:hypothetical protein